MIWASLLVLPRKVLPSVEELLLPAACESEGVAENTHLPVLGGTIAQTWEGFSARNEMN